MSTYLTTQLAGYPDLLKVRDVSAITGYGKTTVGNWLKEGRLRYTVVRRAIYIPKFELIEYYAQRISTPFAANRISNKGTALKGPFCTIHIKMSSSRRKIEYKPLTISKNEAILFKDYHLVYNPFFQLPL